MARSISTGISTLLGASAGYSVYARFEIKDSGGTWRNLSDLEEYDWFVGATWNEDVDQPVAAATIRIARDHSDLLSLSPLRTDSKLNLLTGSYSPLVNPGREVRLWTALVPLGMDSPTYPDDWFLSFHGFIEDVEFADSEIVLECHDLGARVAQAFIESEAVYSNDSGTAVQTVMQSIIDATLGGGVVTLTTSGTPGWNVKTFKQKKEPVLDAIRNLALQIGWDVRYKWSSGSSDFVLTFYEPDRTRVTIDYTLDPSQYLSVKRLNMTRRDVRNRVQVVFSDRATLDAAGQWTRTTTVAQDATSISTFGKQFMEIAEDGASMIDTSTEADRMRDAALADLKDPKADHEIECLFTPHLELGDLIRCKANGVHYDTDQDLAVASITHEISESVQRTTAQVRGKPCGPRAIWLEYEARPGSARTAPFQVPDAPTSLSAAAVQGGAALAFSPPPSGQWDSFEIHKSTSSGFTPSSSTLAQTVRGNRAELGDLTPGTTYYLKVVARDSKGNRSAASAQESIAAGYTPPRAMDPQTVYERLPFNPDFESYTLGTSSPPDSWTDPNATWGVSAEDSTATVQSGGHAIHFSATGAFDPHPELRSELFPVVPGELWEIAAWVKSPASNGGGTCEIVFYTDLGTTTTGSPVSVSFLSGLTSFTRIAASGEVPASAKYGRVLLYSGTNQECWIDNVTARSLGPNWTAPTYGTNWGDGSVGYGLTAMRDRNGRVQLRGTAARSSGSATTAATWPAGLRPGASEYFRVDAADGSSAAIAEINTSGNVILAAAVDSKDYSFSGISYLALN